MKIEQLMEARVAAMKAERARLVESWSPIVKATEAYLAKEGKELNEWQRMNINCGVLVG